VYTTNDDECFVSFFPLVLFCLLLFMHDYWVNEFALFGVGVWISVFQFLAKMGVMQLVLEVHYKDFSSK
jgi:hypothetical protein